MKYSIIAGLSNKARECKQVEFYEVISSHIAAHTPFEVSYIESTDTQILDTTIYNDSIINKNKSYVGR